MKRAENPILLWLIAVANERVQHYHHEPDPDWQETWYLARWNLLDEYLDVCRWLDAEDDAARRTQSGVSGVGRLA